MSENIEVKRRARLVTEGAKILSSRPVLPRFNETNKVLKGVVAESKNPGKKMMKVGAALILMPEPATSAAGVPLIILGRCIASRVATNIKGVYEELHKTLGDLSSL